MSNCDTITLHIPRTSGVAIPVRGDWREFAWPLPGAQTVTCEREDLVWYVCCALSEERVAEVLRETD